MVWGLARGGGCVRWLLPVHRAVSTALQVACSIHSGTEPVSMCCVSLSQVDDGVVYLSLPLTAAGNRGETGVPL